MSTKTWDNIFIILPAYNAAKTLLHTLNEIPPEFRKNIILVDDASTDNTPEIARQAGINVFVHHARGKERSPLIPEVVVHE